MPLLLTTKTLVVGAAVMALLIAGCFIEYWSDRRMLSHRRSNVWWTWLAAALLCGIFVAAVIASQQARARDADGRYANSPLKPWFDKLRSSGGALCCSDADGTALSDVDWETKDGHYRVRLDGEWIDVPDDAVITEPNRAGRTMVWPYYTDGKVNHIRCFMPGSMT